MTRLTLGLVAVFGLASSVFADITFNVIGYPSNPNGAFGVQINGQVTTLKTDQDHFPVWSGVVAGTTSAVQYSYVELSALTGGTVVKSENFTRSLNVTDTATPNEFFQRKTTKWKDLFRLPYSYLATWPSGSKAFRDNQIATLHLTAPKAEVDALNANPAQEATVKATVRFINDDTIYTQTNITLKTSGKSSKDFAKQSYKLSFDDKYNQTFFHRPNIKLRAEATDPTMIRERLYIDMLNAVGVPTQQGAYVRLFINNEPYGLYLMVDDIKKSFIRQTILQDDDTKPVGTMFQCNAGSKEDQADLVWKGPTNTTYSNDAYILVTDPPATGADPMAGLIKFMEDLKDYNPASTPDPVNFWNSTRLELDGFLRNMALEYLGGAFDNYWMAGSNYFIYQNPVLNNRWQWVPTDFDGTFGSGFPTNVLTTYQNYYSFQPDHPLVSKLIIQTPAIQALFNETLKTIVQYTFKPEAMNARIDAVHNMIAEDVAWDIATPKKSPGQQTGFTVDDFNNNLNVATKDMQYGLKPWVADYVKIVTTQMGFDVLPGTADRVTPPPKPGDKPEKGSGGGGKGGRGDHSAGTTVASIGALMTTLLAGVVVLATELLL
ncbi:hypothetical protein DFQ26_002516 [Actinomortierella ambigua]|nr:hypothetical protein DFQ26_002516 [Actinomortierella ambigua]